MKKTLAILIAGLGCTFAGSAFAVSPIVGDSDVEQVRMACDDDGGCWDRGENPGAAIAEGRSVAIEGGRDYRGQGRRDD